MNPSSPSHVSSILPPPFAWIDIPEGEVTLLYDWEGWLESCGLPFDPPRIFHIPAFSIAKYPVTNAQFAHFVKAGGYDQQQWWTDAGWEAKLAGMEWMHGPARLRSTGRAWKKQRYWHDARWNGVDCPVVGVSWYEALAFCAWLSDLSSERITLPTEQQWQRAAQGDDGREYPWGNEWDGERCKNGVGKELFSDSPENGTAPVTQYEGSDKGDSPFGVTDMAGNMWEWCLTVYEMEGIYSHDPEGRVVRGGGLGVAPDLYRVSYRNGFSPFGRTTGMGFRIVRAP